MHIGVLIWSRANDTTGENGKEAGVPECADENDNIPKWTQEEEGLPEWVQDGENENTSFGNGATRDLAQMRRFERSHERSFAHSGLQLGAAAPMGRSPPFALAWECNAACHCESSDIPDPDLGIVGAKDDTGSGGGSSDHHYNLSLLLLRSYANHLMAVQGVAAIVGEHLGNEYVYGLWKGTLCGV
ncbi:hypothetical protein DL765_010946 [Monosporascus sp. GIB2]|nr:hypothetical protein DL765_010946 [Monosporascus sp. GIB2]